MISSLLSLTRLLVPIASTWKPQFPQMASSLGMWQKTCPIALSFFPIHVKRKKSKATALMTVAKLAPMVTPWKRFTATMNSSTTLKTLLLSIIFSFGLLVFVLMTLWHLSTTAMSRNISSKVKSESTKMDLRNQWAVHLLGALGSGHHVHPTETHCWTATKVWCAGAAPPQHQLNCPDITVARAQIAHTQPIARITPPIGHCVLILAQANPVLNGSPNTLTRDLHPTSVL